MADSTSALGVESRPRKRQRARKACLPCRQRKRKCDQQSPCAMCSSFGYQCKYAPDDSPMAGFVDNASTSTSLSIPERSMPANIDRHARHPSIEVVASPSSSTGQGILDPIKSRYMGLHSVMAFPRNLGLDFQSANPPRLHSFGWNCGIRAEEEPTAHGDLRDLISQQEFKTFSERYFSTVHPIFGCLDHKHFMSKAEQFWMEAKAPSGFEAIIAGVSSLGSYFSASLGTPREAEITRHAKEILEDTTIHLSIDHVCAWILRTLYLRLTTRPHRVWMASCITLHVAEALGLHHELDSMILISGNSGARVVGNEVVCEQARRVFWCAWHINSMVSYEYGRSSVVFNKISCKLPREVPGDCLPHLIAISQLIPKEDTYSVSRGVNLQDTLERLMNVPDTHPFISMNKADLCMALYRHFRLQKQVPEKHEVSNIIKIGNEAVEAGYKLAQENRFWWNSLCTVFQYICVLLAIDTTESLACVSTALGTLDKIVALLNSHMANEASNTAKILLRDSINKKRQEISLLEAADVGNKVQPEVPEKMDIDWDSLLDPWFMSTFTGQDISIGEDFTVLAPTL